MNLITKNLALKYANSSRTDNIIPWDDVKNYISINSPELLNDKKWKPVSIFTNSAIQGYFGYALVNGIRHYFVQDFFQYRDDEHTGENITISAVVEIDANGNPISAINFMKSSEPASSMKRTRARCNNMEVILTNAENLDTLMNGDFDNLN